MRIITHPGQAPTNSNFYIEDQDGQRVSSVALTFDIANSWLEIYEGCHIVAFDKYTERDVIPPYEDILFVAHDRYIYSEDDQGAKYGPFLTETAARAHARRYLQERQDDRAHVILVDADGVFLDRLASDRPFWRSRPESRQNSILNKIAQGKGWSAVDFLI